MLKKAIVLAGAKCISVFQKTNIKGSVPADKY